MSLVRQLSPAAKAEIKAMSGARPRAFLLTAATTWLTIAAAVAAALWLHSWLASAFAIYIVATRQNLLALLVHEQTHYLGLNTRHGDWIANLIVAYPLLAVSIEGYAGIHLRHHRFYFSDQDPDFHRKNGREWAFPMPHHRLALLFLCDITGISFVRITLKRARATVSGGGFTRRNPSPAWLKPAFLAAVAAVLTLAGGWGAFALYWLLPLVTVFPVIVRWGAICEHTYGRQGVSIEESSPVIMPSLASKLLLPNLNFAMHAYHHYYPGVSFGNLPALHRVFEREGLVHHDMVFRGQRDYLRFVLFGTRRDPRASAARQGGTAAA